MTSEGGLGRHVRSASKRVWDAAQNVRLCSAVREKELSYAHTPVSPPLPEVEASPSRPPAAWHPAGPTASRAARSGSRTSPVCWELVRQGAPKRSRHLAHRGPISWTAEPKMCETVLQTQRSVYQRACAAVRASCTVFAPKIVSLPSPIVSKWSGSRGLYVLVERLPRQGLLLRQALAPLEHAQQLLLAVVDIPEPRDEQVSRATVRRTV